MESWDKNTQFLIAAFKNDTKTKICQYFLTVVHLSIYSFVDKFLFMNANTYGQDYQHLKTFFKFLQAQMQTTATFTLANLEKFC